VIVRRARLLGAALLGGLGFAAGRASRGPAGSGTASTVAPQAVAPDFTSRLKELSDLHSSGSLTDEEHAAAKAKLLAY